MIEISPNQTNASPAQNAENPSSLSRRQFLAQTGAAVVACSLVQPGQVKGAEANSKINVALLGCGGRGQWIADLFQKHGGYQVSAVYDYFQDKVDAAGQRFQVEVGRRYTGLKGYLRLLEQKTVDAVIIQSPPYFHPEQAAAAVEAGRHVYVAKPIAVDVPGCMTIEESGAKATAKKLCFLVDFQTRAMPAYQEAVKRVHRGDIGRIISGEATYQTGAIFQQVDAQYRKNPQSSEARLRAWGTDRVLSGDIITEQNIHALDVAAWILNAAPLSAYGHGGRAREYFGSCWDHFAVIYYYPNNVLLSFSSKQVGFGWDDIQCRVYGSEGTIDTHYGGKVTVANREEPYNGGETKAIYQEGAVRNIAAFHEQIVQGDHTNATVAPSVRSNLTTILGRTAAYRRAEVTWDQMIQANEKWDADLKGMQA